jgi:hypothetical protein
MNVIVVTYHLASHREIQIFYSSKNGIHTNGSGLTTDIYIKLTLIRPPLVPVKQSTGQARAKTILIRNRN